jgi:hypothetical protein
MGIEHLSFHDQRIADLLADHKKNHFICFDIIQHAQVADAKFEMR